LSEKVSNQERRILKEPIIAENALQKVFGADEFTFELPQPLSTPCSSHSPRPIGCCSTVTLLICVGFNDPEGSVRTCLSDSADLEGPTDGISGDFGTYSKDQLSLFDTKTLRRVLGSASLMISSQDWLWNTIIHWVKSIRFY
jgi:hypothetical protein